MKSVLLSDFEVEVIRHGVKMLRSSCLLEKKAKEPIKEFIIEKCNDVLKKIDDEQKKISDNWKSMLDK